MEGAAMEAAATAVVVRVRAATVAVGSEVAGLAAAGSAAVRAVAWVAREDRAMAAE